MHPFHVCCSEEGLTLLASSNDYLGIGIYSILSISTNPSMQFSFYCFYENCMYLFITKLSFLCIFPPTRKHFCNPTIIIALYFILLCIPFYVFVFIYYLYTHTRTQYTILRLPNIERTSILASILFSYSLLIISHLENNQPFLVLAISKTPKT